MHQAAELDLPEFSDRGGAYRSSLTEPSASILYLALTKAAPATAVCLEYLASGRGLTDLIAISVLGVRDLRAEIIKLRNFGIPIVGEVHQDPSHNHVMVYRYNPGGRSYDEPRHDDTQRFEDDGGPPHPDAA